MKPKFEGGINLAMKVPPHQFDAVVSFYRQTLALEEIEPLQPDIVFRLGPNRLWIDKVSGMSQAEIWLEVITNDTAAATAHLSDAGIVRCDEIEPLPEGSDGFWISSPAQIIHLVRTD